MSKRAMSYCEANFDFCRACGLAEQSKLNRAYLEAQGYERVLEYFEPVRFGAGQPILALAFADAREGLFDVIVATCPFRLMGYGLHGLPAMVKLIQETGVKVEFARMTCEEVRR